MIGTPNDRPFLRVTRPPDDIDALIPFYRDGLGLDVFRFEDHDGFDGVMIGQGAPYHFEFTRAHGHIAGQAPTRDNLLVFYVPDLKGWQARWSG